MNVNFKFLTGVALSGVAGAALLACNATNGLDLNPAPIASQKPVNTAPQAAPKPDASGKVFAGGSQPSPTSAGGNAAAQAEAIPVSGKCLSPNQTGDPDIIRNASKLPTSKYCIQMSAFNESIFAWKIFRITPKNGKRGPFWAVPHDNEDAAFDAAVYALNKYGGALATIETGNTRSFRGQDTNRNFGTSAAIARRCSQQRAAAPKFVREFLKDFKRGGRMIALHTNANGYSGNGGSGTISINRKSSIMRPYKSSQASGVLKDEDNLLLTASKRLVSQDSKLQKFVSHFNRAGVHVIVEHVTAAKNDCSLSNYVILNNLGDYYNIEVQHGALGAQKQILSELMAYR